MADDSAPQAPSSPSPEPAREPHPGGKLRGPGEGMNQQAKNPMAFLLLVVFLCVAGWFIVSWMSDSTKIQDCVMSGRKNCTEMDPRLGR
jgi:hypothetical protein